MSAVICFLKNHRSESLMSAMVLLILAAPLGDSRPHIGGLIALLILLVMLAGASYLANLEESSASLSCPLLSCGSRPGRLRRSATVATFTHISRRLRA